MFKVLCLFNIFICSTIGENKWEIKITHPEYLRVYDLRRKELTGVYNFQSYREVFTLPPEREVAVNVTSKYAVQHGPILHHKDLLEKPGFTWPNNASHYYSLFLTRNTPNFRLWGFDEYQNWVVVNIPGNEIEKGQELIAYNPPLPSKDKDDKFTPEYKVLIYKQPGYVKIPFRNWFLCDRESFAVANFTHDYGLGEPWAWSSFFVDDLSKKIADEKKTS